ncbi:hypothetical protein [Actinomadura spongiicola]|uniref:hypothetical protein n=1 Tax=Actinomadura spongiicola TaxID=2303421 RepID=UPI00131467C8|nr:hypothetical protein [Actinomadura spongiicola]
MPVGVPGLQFQSGRLGHEIEFGGPDVAVRAAEQAGRTARGARRSSAGPSSGREPPAGIDTEMALDLVIAPIHGRSNGLHGTLEPDYFDRVATVIPRALSPN